MDLKAAHTAIFGSGLKALAAHARAYLGSLGMAFAAAILLGFLFPRPALSEWVPGLGDIPAGYYFTTDMEPVEVELGRQLPTAPDFEPLVRLSIPRAYIFFTSEYPQREFGRLPQRIAERELHIMLTYPEGLPYSVAMENYEKATGICCRQAADNIRDLRYIAQIAPTNVDARTWPILSPRPNWVYGELVGEYQGLRFYKNKSGCSTYFGEQGDILRKVQCTEPPESLNSIYFCSYYTVLSKNAYAKIRFVDFRAHGGVAFARDRIALFRKTVCQFMTCDRAD